MQTKPNRRGFIYISIAGIGTAMLHSVIASSAEADAERPTLVIHSNILKHYKFTSEEIAKLETLRGGEEVIEPLLPGNLKTTWKVRPKEHKDNPEEWSSFIKTADRENLLLLAEVSWYKDRKQKRIYWFALLAKD